MPLQVDYANCLADRVGRNGVDSGSLAAAAPLLTRLTERLNKSRGTDWERWRDLPFDPMRREHVDGVRSLVAKLQAKTDHLVILGIGGSALGNIALQAALNPLTYNLMPRPPRRGPRLFVLDNVDPTFVVQTLEEVRRHDAGFERTVFNVISKSGDTSETAAQFLVVRSMLADALGDRHAEHIVAVTDAHEGTLRTICDEQGYASLPIPEGVGGRFSVLSPVGLFSAAMCGIDIEGLLDGAAAMDERCRDRNHRRNPAAMLAWLLTELAKAGKRIHVLMPYCNALYPMADWFRQLWAESLGKKTDADGTEVFAGATPVKALGATDQHSQIQLYRDGPPDKVIGFLEVEQFDQDLAVPTGAGFEPLGYLEGCTLSRLLAAQKRATEYALVESRRPNFTITFPTLDAYHVGEYIQLWEITTAYAGLLLNVNPYDQPAVETGKQATYGLLGRAGYEGWQTQVEHVLSPTPWVV